MTIDLIDQESRMNALDVTRSFHVESPAGSGKTMLLTIRFVKLLGTVEHPSEILALTYTEKAAQEMRSRVVNALQRARRGSPADGDADGVLLQSAAGALERHGGRIDLAASSNALNIMTFHGFCRYLAARAPLEGGINPEFDIIDETMQPQMAKESVDFTMERLGRLPVGHASRTALENRLLYHDNNRRDLEDELADIIQRRDSFADLTGTIRESGGSDPTRLTAVLKERTCFYVERRLAELEKYFVRSELGHRWNEFIHHLEAEGAAAAGMLPRQAPSARWENLYLWKAVAGVLLTKEGTPRKQLGPKTGFYQGFQKSEWGSRITGMPHRLASLLKETCEFPAEDESPADIDVLFDLIILCAEVIGDYEKLCRRRSLVDFTGLEQCALRILDTADPSELSLFLDHRLIHILIDEFQDTNRTQWKLLKYLVSGWEPGDGKTVFIVGDPKQSIYAFRNAEVGLFYEAKDGIPRPGLPPLILSSLRLDTNFRSHQRLIEWTNDLFGTTVMTDPDADADETPFSPSTAAGINGERETPRLDLAVFSDPDRDRARENEAVWLASQVKKLVVETGGTQSLGILLFTRNRLTRYLRALREAGVPVQVEEGLRLADRPETAHLIQMARLLVRPHDDLAWASLLRSPWSWCDISILVETALSEGHSWIDKIRRTSRDRRELQPIIRALDRGMMRIGRDPLGTVVRKFWEDLDGPGITAAVYGMAGVANCIRLCEILNEADRGTPQESLTRFENLMDGFYEPVDPTTARSPVKMMTIHRAKGLEFDIVFLPFLDWRSLSGGNSKNPPYLVERIPGRREDHLIATAKDRRASVPHPLYKILQRFSKQRAWGEAKRLFYVAATRARFHLVMSGVADKKNDCLSPPSDSPLTWILGHETRSRVNPGVETPSSGDSFLSVSVNPPPPGDDGRNVKNSTVVSLPPPIIITPEKPEFTVTPSPSFIPEATSGRDFPGEPVPETGKSAADTALIPARAAIRGTVLHRLLKYYIEKKRFPSSRSVVEALKREGLDGQSALDIAPTLLKEAADTVDSPFIAGLLNADGAIIHTEWKLEEALSSESIRSGAIDLAVFDGTCWWIVDFKSGSPAGGQSVDDYITSESNRYRNQIKAYRRLVEAREESQSAPIRAGIFFTAPGIWREVKP
ncbi:MAG: hypothetical protein AVO39_02585 [delta proteobacterium MLS_D]|nr:MAG: hypothetical protein AVO39_02585 [delta proteobacterium MLS_D]